MTFLAPTFPAITSPWSPQIPSEDEATETQKVLTVEDDFKLLQVLSLINHASSAPIATANLVITYVRAELHKIPGTGLDVASVNQPPPNARLLLPPSTLTPSAAGGTGSA